VPFNSKAKFITMSTDNLPITNSVPSADNGTKPPVIGRFILETLTVDEYLKKYDCCPRCGGNYGVYTRVKSKGTWRDTTCYDGQKENTEMMDSFSDTWESKHIFCSECEKPVAIRSV
jgi:hypothetical protein